MMDVYLYPGNCPSNVAKDAKYSIKHGDDGNWAVHLLYTVNDSERELLTTNGHPKLVEMVNLVKREIMGSEGGAFYINEYGQVIVPTKHGALYAGTYHKELRFEFEGSTLGPSAPEGLRPGDEWKGPHPGVRYTLAASCDDVYYMRKLTKTREEKVRLSAETSKAAAARLAHRLAANKGNRGGRIYLNERCEFFAPIEGAEGWRFVYLGHLDDDAWFHEYDMSEFEG